MEGRLVGVEEGRPEEVQGVAAGREGGSGGRAEGDEQAPVGMRWD